MPEEKKKKHEGSGQGSLAGHIWSWMWPTEHYQTSPCGHNWGWQGFSNVWLCSHWHAWLWTECAKSPRTLKFSNKSCHSDANWATACIYVRVTSSQSVCVCVYVCLWECVCIWEWKQESVISQYSMEGFFHDTKQATVCCHFFLSFINSSLQVAASFRKIVITSKTSF